MENKENFLIDSGRNIFISTAIPYVNARPHIGFALELVQADGLARFWRSRGKEVFFLTGTDENSLKNVQAAEKAGEEVGAFIERHALAFKELLEKLNISNSDFIRTSIEERHIEGAKKLWEACSHDIYKKSYKGLYCIGCEEFKLEKDLLEGKCPEHLNKELEVVEEENYFFKLSKYQDEILRLIESGEIIVRPESRKNELVSFIRSGLQDFSISRSKGRAKNWGIEVPGDSEQIMYVWFDALSNYITALGYAEEEERYKKFWEEGGRRVHEIGKGIIRFHAIYWPAMLLSAGVKLPTEILVHGYITNNGVKMSKSLGNIVDPFEMVQKYGSEAVRYYLLREIPSGADGDFSEDKFLARYNGDLANGLGNFASRILKLAEKYGSWQEEKIKEEELIEAKELIETAIKRFEIHNALAAIWQLIALGDEHISYEKPWETGDKRVIGEALYILAETAQLLEPFMPETSQEILKAIKEKRALKAPLFPRV